MSPRRTDSPAMSMSGRERAESGAIVAFENERGRVFSIHRVGPVRAAVRQACAIAMLRDESFRVVAVSTPNTIYGDLAGRLPVSESGAPSEHRHPERALLSAAGVLPLLHSRLCAGSRNAETNRRGAA